MLESVSMDALGIAVTILAAICSPLVGHVLSNPRWRLQAVLKHHQQSNAVTVVLRNVSSRTVFVDRVMLYHPSFLPRPFRQFA
ncbi:MAG: hypothetical protein Q4Q62_06530, partial [Thermoplasmata archaeon]|nr:hypothetical protein [Thermoplasmata archaeon]